jgi:hypothetical protein
MTASQISRLRLALTLACLTAALAYCAASVFQGEWNEFARWLGQIPATFKHSGRRRAFLIPWLFPLAAAYVLALTSGIFWGLRRLEYRRR